MREEKMAMDVKRGLRFGGHTEDRDQGDEGDLGGQKHRFLPFLFTHISPKTKPIVVSYNTKLMTICYYA